jgi:tetratricopeptide (TPR) repeat protein
VTQGVRCESCTKMHTGATILANHRKSSRRVKHALKFVAVLLGLVLSAVGGVIVGNHPSLGGLLIALGIIGAAYSYLSSARQQSENEKYFDASARILFGAGIGNPYTQMVEDEFKRSGTYKDVLPRLDKAFDVNPNDSDALAWYVRFASLQISFSHLLGRQDTRPDRDELRKVASRIEQGIKTGRNLTVFYSAKGILLDVAGEHSQARSWYVRAGGLRSDPYWRLLVCTSYGMEGEYVNGLKEIEKAIEEGASGYLADYYHGRALASVGEYDAALAKYELARAERGLFYQLTVSIQEAYYYKWKVIASANFEMLSAWYVFSRDWRRSLNHLTHSTVHYFVPSFIWILKMTSRIARRLPALRRSKAATLYSPGQPHSTLGLKLAEQRRYIAAKKMFAIAAAKSEDASSLLNLCTAAMLTNDWEEAEEACSTALEREPNNELAKSYMEAIEHRKVYGSVEIAVAEDL